MIFIYALANIPKIGKIEKTNFDELPKINSRIKIMRFGTKVLKFNF